MRAYIYFIIFLVTFTANSQRKKVRDTSTFIHQPNRIEFDMGSENHEFHVINGEKNGLMVVIQTNDYSGDGQMWVVHYLDTALNVLWTRNYSVPLESAFTGYDYFDGRYYLLFNASKYRNEELLIYEIQHETAELKTFEVSTVFPITLSYFEVLGNSILLGGYTNFRPVMLTYDLIEQKPKVIPGFYESNSELLDIIIDDNAQIVTVLQTERLLNRKNTVRAKTFTANGDLIQDNIVNPGERRNIIDGTATTFYGGFQYMAGTYSKRSSHYSRGLYLGKFINGRQQFIRFHEYADLTNFFGFMSDRREQRIKERIERKRQKGKNPGFSYRLTVHDIIQRGDEYIMIAEAYYPTYNSYNRGPISAMGGGSYTPSFTGYRYTHAVVVSFDKNGNIRWDNSFEIDDIQTFSLQEFVSVSVYDDKVVLMYLEGNTIRSKVVEGDDIFEGKTFNPVKLSYDDDEITNKNPAIEGLEKWYDNTLYAFGEQRIKNESGTGGRINRKIFYINKVQYHLDEPAESSQ